MIKTLPYYRMFEELESDPLHEQSSLAYHFAFLAAFSQPTTELRRAIQRKIDEYSSYVELLSLPPPTNCVPIEIPLMRPEAIHPLISFSLHLSLNSVQLVFDC